MSVKKIFPSKKFFFDFINLFLDLDKKTNMEGPEKEIFEEDTADIGELSINSQMEVQSPDEKSAEAEESSQALVQPQSQGLTASQQIVSQFQGYYNTYKRKVVRGPLGFTGGHQCGYTPEKVGREQDRE